MYNANDVKTLREKTGAGMLDCKKALDEVNGDIEKAIDYLREKGISKAAKKESRIAAEGLVNVAINGNNAIIVEINSETDFVTLNDEFKSLISKISEGLVNSNVTTMEEANDVLVDGEKISDLVINATAKIGEKISFRRFERIVKSDNESFGSYLHMGGKIGVLVVTTTNEEVSRDVAMHIAAMNPSAIRREEVDPELVEREKEIIKEQAINEGKPADIAEKMVNGRINKFYQEICLNEQPFVKNGDITVSDYIKSVGGDVIKMIRYQAGEGIEKRSDDFATEVMNQIK